MGRREVLTAVLAAWPWSGLMAQRASEPAARTEVYAGSELETYLRNLQVVGAVPAYPWSARRFTAAEVDRLLPSDSSHPWELRYDWRPAPEGEWSVALARPELAARLNSSFPFGYNDGAVWAGRGITVSAQGGFAVRYGPVAAAIVPLAAWASNSAFRLQPNGQSGALQYADGGAPTTIDRPQRFGGGGYAVVSGGQSVLEVVGRGMTAGVSMANGSWGPAAEFPLVLGNNAGGFPHVFAGTAAPLDVRVARMHFRAVFGRLTQSAYSSQTGEGSVRAASGVVVVVLPRWPPGLELGGSRSIHRLWSRRASLLDEFLYLFATNPRDTTSLFHASTNDSLENQVASVFFRWTFPSVGLEVYGEYATEDSRYSLRDVFVTPDHAGAYTLGLRWVERTSIGRMRVLRAEVQDAEPGTLVQEPRGLPRFYEHSGLRSGHTFEGQVLGSEWATLGGAAATVAADWYDGGGRLTVAWSRFVRRNHAALSAATSAQDPRGLDVLHTLRLERLFFRGRYDLWAGATAAYEFNRDFRGDAFNLNMIAAVRIGLR